MSDAERAAFIEATLSNQLVAERALHNGDITPRLTTWSQADPVTVFGAAGACESGWDALRPLFEWVAASFTGCDEYDFELIAADASGDLAYTVGIERYRAMTAAGHEVANTLRVTHVYRREADGWRIVHRHGDHLSAAPGPTTLSL